MDKKITAVEWFADKIDSLVPYIDEDTAKQFKDYLQQAKEIEDLMIDRAIDFGIKVEFGNIKRNYEKYTSILNQFKETYGE